MPNPEVPDLNEEAREPSLDPSHENTMRSTNGPNIIPLEWSTAWRNPRPVRPLPGRSPHMSRREQELGASMWDETMDAHTNKRYDIWVLDNRGIRSRDPDDGSFMYLHPPTTTRPPEMLPLVYRLVEGGIELGHFPDKDPPLDRDDLEVETAHSFCMFCRDVFDYYCWWRSQAASNESGSKADLPPNGVIHHHNLVTLIWSDYNDCHLCSSILQRLLWMDGEALYPSQNLTRFRIEACWPLQIERTAEEQNPDRKSARGQDPSHRMFFALVDPKLPKKQWNWSEVYRLQLWRKSRFEKYFAGDTKDPLVSATKALTLADSGHKDKGRSTSSKQSIALSRSWLQQCLDNVDGKHTECGRKADTAKLPHRILDVEESKRTGMLKLVCPYDGSHSDGEHNPNDRYITLSHKWGTHKLPLLLKSNIESRKIDGISIDELPKTFRQAVEVTAWFNVRYLYIDSLCIIQDSHDDWVQEAARMGDYYACAMLNISASHASDACDGCFVARDPLAITTPIITHPRNPDLSWYVARDHHQQWAWMLRMPCFTRAWICRERQMSPRILHFTDQEVVWECCGRDGASFASETFPGGAPFQRLFGLNTKYQSKDLRGLEKEEVGEIYAVWNQLAAQFSQQNLTKGSDMPIILAGPAEDFAALLPPQEWYCTGLWRSKLPLALLWTVTEHRDWEAFDYVAPSWSWMSLRAPVELYDDPATSSRPVHTLAIIEDLKTIEKYDAQPFGPLREASITLTCIVRRANFNLEDGQLVLSVCEEGLEGAPWRDIGPAWHEYYGDRFELQLDREWDFRGREEEGRSLFCSLAFLALKPAWQKGMTNQREILALVLQSEDEAAASRYREYDEGDDPDAGQEDPRPVWYDDDEEEDLPGRCWGSVQRHGDDDGEPVVYRRIGVITLDDYYAFMTRYQLDPISEVIQQRYWDKHPNSKKGGKTGPTTASSFFEKVAQKIVIETDKMYEADEKAAEAEQDGDGGRKRKNERMKRDSDPMLVYDFDECLTATGFIGEEELLQQLTAEKIVIV